MQWGETIFVEAASAAEIDHLKTKLVVVTALIVTMVACGFAPGTQGILMIGSVVGLLFGLAAVGVIFLW